ncbi:hypothetical protein GGR52DRAFT_416535 [Hypoxylon sp. FL1284]|nr:hypothetical protein GGR52DRAFT_416535 [Hypoxylon sp. FL1284]
MRTLGAFLLRGGTYARSPSLFALSTLLTHENTGHTQTSSIAMIRVFPKWHLLAKRAMKILRGWSFLDMRLLCSSSPLVLGTRTVEPDS